MTWPMYRQRTGQPRAAWGNRSEAFRSRLPLAPAAPGFLQAAYCGSEAAQRSTTPAFRPWVRPGSPLRSFRSPQTCRCDYPWGPSRRRGSRSVAGAESPCSGYRRSPRSLARSATSPTIPARWHTAVLQFQLVTEVPLDSPWKLYISTIKNIYMHGVRESTNFII